MRVGVELVDDARRDALQELRREVRDLFLVAGREGGEAGGVEGLVLDGAQRGQRLRRRHRDGDFLHGIPLTLLRVSGRSPAPMARTGHLPYSSGASGMAGSGAVGRAGRPDDWSGVRGTVPCSLRETGASVGSGPWSAPLTEWR